MTVLRLIVFIFSTVLLQGCIGPQIYSEAFIKQNTDWEMIKQPGYEGPSTDVAILVGKDIKIRIEASNGIVEDDIFIIKVMFYSKHNNFQFDPSNAYVKLSNNKTINAKGLPCAYTIHDLDYLRGALPIEKPVPLDEGIGDINKIDKCFKLFFDTQPPSVEEEFVLILNGLTKSGKPVSIPEIFFRKATR